MKHSVIYRIHHQGIIVDATQAIMELTVIRIFVVPILVKMVEIVL